MHPFTTADASPMFVRSAQQATPPAERRPEAPPAPAIAPAGETGYGLEFEPELERWDGLA